MKTKPFRKLLGLGILLAGFSLIGCTDDETTAAAQNRRIPQTAGFIEGDNPDSSSMIVDKPDRTILKVRESRSPSLAKMDSFQFMSEKVGFAFNGKKLLRTTDGEKWTEIPVSVPGKRYIATAQFSDEKTGFVVVQLNENYYGPDPQRQFSILSTSDGGKTWQTSYEAPTVIIDGSYVGPSGARFVFGTRYPDPEHLQGYIYILRSSDGANWRDISTELDSHLAAEAKKRGVQYGNDTITNMAVGADGKAHLITHSRQLFDSDDLGATWRKVGQYLHDDPQVGIKNFGVMDDGSNWMFESTFSIEGIRARLRTIKGSVVTRPTVEGVYLGSAYYLGGESFLTAGQTGSLLRTNPSRAIVLETDNRAKTWRTLYKSSTASNVVSLVQVSTNSYKALCNDGTVLTIERSGDKL